MRKFLKYISLPIIAITFVLTLASCSGSNFYKTFKALGAEIEKENCFTELTLDEFKLMLLEELRPKKEAVVDDEEEVENEEDSQIN